MMRISVGVAVLAAAGLAAQDRAGADLGDGQKAFQGTWTIVELEKGKAGDQPVSAPTVEFRGDKYAIKAGDQTVEEGTFRADARKAPNRIEVTVTAGKDKGQKWHGIYELEGDTLRAVVGPTDKDLPKSLVKPEAGQRAFTLKRATPAKR